MQYADSRSSLERQDHETVPEESASGYNEGDRVGVTAGRPRGRKSKRGHSIPCVEGLLVQKDARAAWELAEDTLQSSFSPNYFQVYLSNENRTLEMCVSFPRGIPARKSLSSQEDESTASLPAVLCCTVLCFVCVCVCVYCQCPGASTARLKGFLEENPLVSFFF